MFVVQSELPIFTRSYDLLVWLLNASNHFPRAQRQTLTRRLTCVSIWMPPSGVWAANGWPACAWRLRWSGSAPGSTVTPRGCWLKSAAFSAAGLRLRSRRGGFLYLAVDMPSDQHLLRGGAFDNGSHGLRCAIRYRYLPFTRYEDLGFRVLVSPFS